MSTAPVPEARAMVTAARQFVAGDIDFLAMRGPILECRMWARVHNADARIQQLAAEWSELVEQAWNEFGINPNPLSVKELRARIADDLGSRVEGTA